MKIENNFVLVAPNMMIDPASKIIIREDRFLLDDASHGFWVEYDPEMSAAHIRRRMTDSEIAFHESLKIPRPADYMIPNTSPSTRRLFFLSLFETSAGNGVTLEPHANEAEFVALYKSLARTGIRNISDNSGWFIDYVLLSTLHWYGATGNAGVNPNADEFTMVMDESLARHLPSYSSRSLEADGEGRIVFGKIGRRRQGLL